MEFWNSRDLCTYVGVVENIGAVVENVGTPTDNNMKR
jgi:hypothetical protein